MHLISDLIDDTLCVIELPGDPIPAARPRVTRFRGTYDPKQKEKKIAQTYMAQQWKKNPHDCPIRLEISFLMPKPSSWSQKQKIRQENASHVKKPDIDNLIKFTMDVMSGIVFRDDSCVYDLKAIKLYSETPKTIIKVMKNK
jgi:Holliday junction resolvase RusA-like endonuclease